MQKSNVVYINFKVMNMFLKGYSNRKEFIRLTDYKPDSWDSVLYNLFITFFELIDLYEYIKAIATL